MVHTSPTIGCRLLQSYYWTALLSNTVGFYAAAAVLEPFRGRRVWASMLHRWARSCLRTGFFECNVEHAERLAQPCVAVSNHRSVFDIAVLSALLPPPAFFVARRELLRAPFIGGTLRRGGHLILDPDDGPGLRRLVQQAVERVKDGGRVVVFPEGTRAEGDRSGPFSPGAFRIASRAGRPVVPIAVAGTERTIARGSRLIRSGRIAVSVLEPVSVSRSDALDPAFHESIRRAVADRVARLCRPGSVDLAPDAGRAATTTVHGPEGV